MEAKILEPAREEAFVVDQGDLTAHAGDGADASFLGVDKSGSPPALRLLAGQRRPSLAGVARGEDAGRDLGGRLSDDDSLVETKELHVMQTRKRSGSEFRPMFPAVAGV